ncbi:Crp/Fnr family transcriptional regulator [Pelomicrobium methylotrophicum]|uniref:Crp/Fnr family transcriptional regulator n=1 Tax=Pelomicrobium methylotrophicum TaxID=2602750 RepID=A0A5C7EP58_9PROT|nr:Crp/Fnr family transcriptional regulator [Pelomicrobium methylotrophicum]TXF10047.1 Crp/Fnr family transcriptional regulator [Pelomicrobium methylotrophicum]
MTSDKIIPIRLRNPGSGTDEANPSPVRVHVPTHPASHGLRTVAAPFAALPPEEKALLLSRCIRKRIPRGTTVFTQGHLHTATYIIESGLVRTYYTAATGKEVTMAYWSEGDLIGGPNVLTADTVHVWSARAVEDSVVWCIAAKELENLVHTRPLIARFIIDSMTVKLFWVSSLLQAFGTQSVFLRLAHLLLKLAEMYGVPTKSGIAIRYHFTQEDLANMVGATRQWVSTTLRHFQRDNIIRSGKRLLEIQNIELLRRIVGEPDLTGGRHSK